MLHNKQSIFCPTYLLGLAFINIAILALHTYLLVTVLTVLNTRIDTSFIVASLLKK